jgi:hypothetical protein
MRLRFLSYTQQSRRTGSFGHFAVLQEISDCMGMRGGGPC